MKAVIVLLATAAAFAYGAPKFELKFIRKEVVCLHNKTLSTEQFDSVFVKDLKKNGSDNCEPEFFCQAERVLSEVKKLPNFYKEIGDCRVDKLLRNLKVYHNNATCTVPTGDEIILRLFLDDLNKCTQKVFLQ